VPSSLFKPVCSGVSGNFFALRLPTLRLAGKAVCIVTFHFCGPSRSTTCTVVLLTHDVKLISSYHYVVDVKSTLVSLPSKVDSIEVDVLSTNRVGSFVLLENNNHTLLSASDIGDNILHCE